MLNIAKRVINRFQLSAYDRCVTCALIDRRAGKLMEDPVVAEQRSNLTGKPIMKTVDGVTKQVTNDAGELQYEAINDSFVRQALIDAGLTRKRKMEIPDDFDLQTYYNAYIN